MQIVLSRLRIIVKRRSLYLYLHLTPYVMQVNLH